MLKFCAWKKCGREFEASRVTQRFCSKKCCDSHGYWVRHINLPEAHWRDKELTCDYLGCDNVFTPKIGVQRFCSATCRIAAENQRRRKLEPKTCVQCSALFHPRCAQAKYCSEECRNHGHAAKQRAMRAAKSEAEVRRMVLHTDTPAGRNLYAWLKWRRGTVEVVAV